MNYWLLILLLLLWIKIAVSFEIYSNITIFLFERHLFKYCSCVWSFAITTCVWLFCIACPCYSDRCTAPRRSSKRCRHIESDKQSAVTCTRTYAVEKGWNLGIEGWQSRTKLFLLSFLFFFFYRVNFNKLHSLIITK